MKTQHNTSSRRIRMRWLTLSVLALSLFTQNLLAADDPLQLQFNELAPGVWLGNRPDSTRLPVTPNTTFVVSDEGVVVFDGGNLPLVADRVIAKIRTITDQPVTHVVISHWHMDHVLGVSRYLQAFPNVQVIAHPYTRELILRYLAVNEQNMRNTVSDNKPGIESLLASEAAASLDARTVTWFQQFIEDADLLEEQYRNFVPAHPNLLFSDALTIHSGQLSDSPTIQSSQLSDALTIHSGQREIQLLHPGTGNTPGDLVMWLPEEKILASGDIVVWPTPYGHGGRATEWAATLRTLAAMDFEHLIPGHGDVQVSRGDPQMDRHGGQANLDDVQVSRGDVQMDRHGGQANFDDVQVSRGDVQMDRHGGQANLDDVQVSRDYLDLMAKTLDSVASQVAALSEQGKTLEETRAAIDLSAFESQFTQGDVFLQARFNEWFTQPIVEAAWKEANGKDPEIVQ